MPSTYSIIEDSILDYFKTETKITKRQKFEKIIIELEKIYNEMIPLNRNLKDTFLLLSNLQRFYGMNRYPALYYIYNNSSWEYIENDIKEKENILFKDALIAYHRMNQIRTLLTGEKITYRVAAGSQKREYLLQANLTYEEIQKQLYLQRRANGYTIRLKVSQTGLKTLAGDKIQEISKQNPSSLYSAVYRYYTEKRVGKKGAGNWGNFYEAYRYLYLKYNGDNTQLPSDADLLESFNAVLAGGGKSGSFTRGGDVGSEQDKAAFGSYPSLTSIDTILITLKEIIEMLTDFINGNSQGLISLLVNKRVDQKVTDMAQQYGVEEITKSIKEFLTK